MKYAFRFTTTARRQVRTVDRTSAMRVLTALTRLGDHPYREDADVKKLAGQEGLYRLLVEDVRVAYGIDDGRLIILAVRVGSRRDVHHAL